MEKILCIFCIAILTIGVQAQEDIKKFRDKFDDVIEEDENQNLTLRFFNALNGNPIQGAKITIKDITAVVSDAEGKVRFETPEEDGMLLVRFECPKYITADFKIEVIAGTLLFNRISISPMIDLKNVRIVLDWEKSPADLDAHFMKENGYHISYRNTKALADGSALLDRDDMDGYGPETITIHDINDLSTYEFLVHDFSNKANTQSAELSRSKATVKVFGEGKLLYVFTVPQGAKGTKWSVFQIHAGQFVEVNELF